MSDGDEAQDAENAYWDGVYGSYEADDGYVPSDDWED